MTNRLEPIIQQKKIEVATLYNVIKAQPDHIINKILAGEIKRTAGNLFKRSLCRSTLAVIAEIKRKSPSKGELAPINNPIELADKYIQGGANALSILTDSKFFGGSLDDLTSVIAKLNHKPTPILRKDFIIDEIQIAETIAAGADAILCIVAVHGNNTGAILKHAATMGIDVLVEVHNEAELDIALENNAEIIGINNRNLNTFEVDPETAYRLKKLIPDDIITVAESGMTQPQDANNYRQAGFNAVLIGEALVKSTNPQQFIRACQES